MNLEFSAVDNGICVYFLFEIVVIYAWRALIFAETTKLRYITMDVQHQASWGKCSEQWFIDGGFCSITCNKCTCQAPVPTYCSCSDQPPDQTFSCSDQVIHFVQILWMGKKSGTLALCGCAVLAWFTWICGVKVHSHSACTLQYGAMIIYWHSWQNCLAPPPPPAPSPPPRRNCLASIQIPLPQPDLLGESFFRPWFGLAKQPNYCSTTQPNKLLTCGHAVWW